MLVNRDDIVLEALSWEGVRWRHQGRTKLGVDCAGLIVMVGKALGILDYDATGYRREPQRDVFISHFRNNFDEKNVADRLPGDVLLMRSQRFTCHCAIVTDRDYIIHAFASRRRVVHERYVGEWPNLTTHCFSYRGVED